MATSNASQYTPLDVPLRPLPADEVFSEPQWETFFALIDTVVPSIQSAKSPDSKVPPTGEFEAAYSSLKTLVGGPNASQLATQYLEEKAIEIPRVRDLLKQTMGTLVPMHARRGLGLILGVLGTRPGSLLLTGYTTIFQDQPFEIREKILQGWLTSRLPPLRAFSRAFLLLGKKAWLTHSSTLGPVLGFPRTPVHGKPADGFDFQFLQLPPGDSPEVLETDVVIVGSGCGGAVAAKNLAEAGHRVIVVEKSYYYLPKHFPMAVDAAGERLFESGGSLGSDDSSIVVLAGSTWGGGGTINWSASLQTQNFVRQEWADEGLPFFTSPEFQTSLDRVCTRMGVTSEINHNLSNRMVLEGARKLGYSAKTVPQNIADHEHYCGYCTYGCHTVGKQGPVATWLVDAAKAGAIFLEGFTADKVVFDTVNGTKVASAVQGVWTSRDSHLGTGGEGVTKRKVVIKAKKVIVSTGTLNSPLLLLRSGLQNPNIGRNLHLHPVLLGAAVFDEEVRPWEGACLTTVVSCFENLDGYGHGAKVEATCMLPAMFLPLFPWKDGLQYKMFSAKMSRMAGFISLTRDRDAGRVYPDPTDGRIRVQYTASPFDRTHIVEGLIAAAKIAYVSGAKEFHTSYTDMPPFIREPDASHSEGIDGGINNNAFQTWEKMFRSKVPLRADMGTFASAHQMGTCRMGVSPERSVVDPEGRVWGTENLYVVDASVFPSASGVNPMITNMAISDWTSRNIAKQIDRENKKTASSRL